MSGWKALPDELDPRVRAFTERIRRLIDRSGLGVVAVAERTGHERSAWNAYLSGRQPVPRGAVVALAEVTGADAGELTALWERAERARAEAVSGAAVSGTAVSGTAVSGTAGATGGAPRPGAPGDDHTLRIRRVDRAPSPKPPAPDPRPAPSPASVPPPSPAPVPPPSRRRTVLLYAAGILGALLVVTAALLLVDLGGGDDGPDGTDGRAAAPPTATTAPSPTPRTGLPPGVKCSGADCAGRDPEAMGCGGDLAATVARARVGTARVEVRHSTVCAASWARITGAAPGDTVTVEVGGAVRSALVPVGAAGTPAKTDAYTPMLTDAPGTRARACGALADGSEGCTKARR